MSAGECHLCGTVWTGDDNTDSAAHCDAVRRLKAQLAKVTAERDAARRAHARAVLGNGDSAHVHDGTCPRKIVHVTTPEECAAVFWGQAEADRLFGRTPAGVTP